MPIQLSDSLQLAMYGDDAILRDLSILEQLFKDGDRSALFGALALCARFQAVIPEWAADALLAAEDALISGKAADFNAIFGYEEGKSEQKKRRRESALQKHEKAVIEALFKHRADGGSFNADEAFGTVSDELGIPRRDVEEIYRRHKWLKTVSQTANDDVRGFALIELPQPPRRHGRSIL